MLYIKLEDNALTLADYQSPTPQRREEALSLGKVVGDEPLLTLRQRHVTSETMLKTCLAEMHGENDAFVPKALEGGIDVLVCGPTTIVPDEELRHHDATQLFNSCFCFTDDAERTVFTAPLPTLHSTLLYGVKTLHVEALHQEFSATELRFVPSLAPLLSHFAERYEASQQLRMYVNCRHRFIDVFGFDGRRLLFFNSFPVNSPDDAVYYVLALMQSLGFSASTTPCQIMGDQSMTSELLPRLQRFVKQVQGLKVKEYFDIPLLSPQTEVPFDLVAYVKG